jgi:GDP-4-dehydro-6-deoxy-D-mannose reductase
MTSSPRILLLGAGGFVGGYLRSELQAYFPKDTRIVATSRAPCESADLVPLDMTDAQAMRRIIQSEKPTHVVNLVGIAAPVEARKSPDLAWEVHAKAPERLGRLLMEEAPDCWLLHVGSGLVYGKTALSGEAITEASVLAPMDPYGVTKAAGDLAVGALANEGLKSIRLRPFNHTGPRQTEDFVVPAFSAQIARIKKGEQPPVMRVGELSAIRDFLDVRDVARAYTQIIAQSDTLEPGSVFNVASGQGVSIQKILQDLISLSGVDVEVELDPARQRPSDVPKIVGSSAALTKATGWKPERRLGETLRDMLASFS